MSEPPAVTRSCREILWLTAAVCQALGTLSNSSAVMIWALGDLLQGYCFCRLADAQLCPGGAQKTEGGDHCPACRQTCCIQDKRRHHKCDSSTDWLTLLQAMRGKLDSSPFSVVPVCNAWSQSPLPKLTGDTCTACTESHACLMLDQD